MAIIKQLLYLNPKKNLILKSSMIINAFTYLAIQGSISSSYNLLLSFICTLQTLALIMEPQNHIFKVIQWLDPSNYLKVNLIVIYGLSLLFIFLIVLIVILLVAQKNQELVLSSTLIRLIGTFLLHLQILCKTILLVPFLRASLLVLQSSSDSVMLTLSAFTLVLYLVLLLPLLIYISSNTFILTPQLNRKLNYCNTQVCTSVFRVFFVFANVLNNSAMPFLCGFYFFVYFCLTIKRPVFAYTFERANKAMVSAVGYMALVRVFNSIFTRNSSVLVQLLGMLGYIALVQLITNVRTQRILRRAEPSIYQFKLLFFMVGDLHRHMGTLEHFILSHHQKCNSPVCRCSEVVRHLSSKDSDLTADKIWYEFLESFVKAHFSLEDISKLPESELQARLTKYQYLVVDLVEIQLFKLGKLNEAYYVLSNFAALIQRKKMRSPVFEQKRAVMKFYLQQAIRKKYKMDGVTNQYADKFMNFQIEFENYRKLLLKAASKTAELWQEMNKREPHQMTIIKYLKNLQRWNGQISQLYTKMEQTFQNTNQVLEQITIDYFKMVLNVSISSPFHVVEAPEFQQLPNKKTFKFQRLSQNMQSFALDSKTPMCFVSVQKQDFSQIKNFNNFFDKLMKLQYGHIFSIKQLIIPEMRDFHRKKMQKFIEGDYLTRQHENSFTLNSEGKLVYTKLLVQVMPTINMGFQYVVYFRTFLPRKKIICIKNQNYLAYSSSSFCDYVKARFTKSPLIGYVTASIQQQIRSQGKALLSLEEGEFELKFIYEFIQKQIKYLFLQIVDRNMEDIDDPSHIKQRTHSKSIGYEIEDQIKDVQSEYQNQFKMQQIKEQSEQYYKNIQSQKKKTIILKQTFQIILNKSNRKSVTSISLFIKIAGLIRIALLIAVILVKLGNRKDYLTAMQINSNYHTFMLLLSHYALNFKLINLYAYQNILANTTNNLFKQIQNYQPLGPAMDNFLYLFDISTLSQTWPTFAVYKNSSYSAALQNNFLGFSDNILNPITNLNLSNTSSFSFPFALQLNNAKSLSNTASFFFQFITNTIYSFLPNFRNLKIQIMDPILDNQLNNYSIIIVLNVCALIVTGIWIIWIVYRHCRIILLKHLAYNFLQSLKGDLLAQKENRCLHFLQKYQTYTKADNEQLKKKSEKDRKSKLSNHFFSLIDTQNQELSLEHSKNIDQQSKHFVKNYKSLKKTSSFKNVKKEGKSIFKSDNFLCNFMKYFLPCFPLIIYTVIHSSYEVTQNKNFKTMLLIQQNIQKMQQDIINLRLYSMQFSSHSEYLQKYLDISKVLQSLITQLFASEKILLNRNKFNNLPLTTHLIQIIQNEDVCQLEQQGLFSYSNFNFEGRGNISYCRSITNQMLTKGVISSLLIYIQSANTIFYANSRIKTYNTTQKMSFLNDNFFTDVARLTDYFTIILDTALYSFQVDYKQYVSKSAIIIVCICGFFIFWLFIIIFLFRNYYLNIIKWHILEIHSIFTLISYETVLGNQKLKQFVLQNVSQFKIIR